MAVKNNKVKFYYFFFVFLPLYYGEFRYPYSYTYLVCAIELIRQFNFAERDRFFHPMSAEVR